MPADRAAMAAVLAAAFADDPAMLWLFADPATRPKRLARFFNLILNADARLAQAHLACTGDGRIAGVALWRPPGAWALPATAVLASLPRLIHTFGSGSLRALGLMQAMDHQHDQRPHWYLQFIGVAPSAQGRGLGSALLAAGLARADPAAAYLETATASNVGLYRAHGFAVQCQWQHGDGPPFWSMWHAGGGG